MTGKLTQRLSLFVLCAAALFAAGCSSKGKAHTPVKLKRIAHATVRGHEIWSRSIGDGSGKLYAELRIAVAEDALFAASTDGRVYAVEPKTGKPIWHANTKARIISGPSVDGDMVLIGTIDGAVIALKRADGKQLWRAMAPSEAMAPPVGSGDIVVAKSIDGRAYGLDAASGAVKWAFDRNEPSLTLRGLSAPLIIGGRVYLGLDNGKLATVNLADGQTVWEQAISVPTGRADFDRLTDLDADLLPADDGLFVVTYGGDLALIDLGSGDSRWRRSIKSYSGMSAGAGKLFVTDDDGVVWALDADTGAVAWKNEDLKYRHLSAPVFCNGAVGVADFQGYVHWLNAANGTLAGRGKLGGKPVIVPPVAVDDTAYFLDVAGNLEALQPLPVTP